MKLKGNAWKFGNHIDTDVIIPARYLTSSDPKELAKYCMIDGDADFTKKIKQGDIIVAGVNFGCGSSREHAPISIKAAGISCVIAKTFARIFYRNSINIGLPILECPEASEKITEGDEISIDIDKGLIKNISKNESYQAAQFPPFMQDIINKNGLINSIKKS